MVCEEFVGQKQHSPSCLVLVRGLVVVLSQVLGFKESVQMGSYRLSQVGPGTNYTNSILNCFHNLIIVSVHIFLPWTLKAVFIMELNQKMKLMIIVALLKEPSKCLISSVHFLSYEDCKLHQTLSLQVTRQLYEPLVMQLIHWFTNNKKFESQDTVALLEAILVSSVWNSVLSF